MWSVFKKTNWLCLCPSYLVGAKLRGLGDNMMLLGKIL